MRARRIPRIMIAAPASGSGKTMVVCGLLQLLQERQKIMAFKCGPDYIDPMFHQSILETPSRNLDVWMSDPDTVCQLLLGHAEQQEAQLCLIEGVMGYYDGLGNSLKGSSYELSVITQTPVILVANAAGAGRSLAATIRGFMEYQPDQQIRGVILNHCSQKLFEGLRPVLEEELGCAVLGYLPKLTKIQFPGRHLGLILPDEAWGLRMRIRALARQMERTIDLERLLAIAGEAPDLSVKESSFIRPGRLGEAKRVRIGLAQDEAFCFYYEDNLDLLRILGAELVPFSPLYDRELPKGLDGIYMGGGYPELHAQELSQNRSMREELKNAVENGLPCLAECGSFMYLHEAMEDVEGTFWPMVGLVPGRSFRTGKLVRFGYCELTAQEETILGPQGLKLRAHEFHYWDSEVQEGAFSAQKPGRDAVWKCLYKKRNLLAGYPHLYFPGSPCAAENFVRICRERKIDSEAEA